MLLRAGNEDLVYVLIGSEVKCFDVYLVKLIVLNECKNFLVYGMKKSCYLWYDSIICHFLLVVP